MGKGGNRCTICAHAKRPQLELGLVLGTSANVLARRFEVSADALHRHRTNHLSPAQVAAILTAARPASGVDLDALRVSESEGLLSSLVVQRGRLQSHLEMASEVGDVKACVAVERAILENLGLVGRLLGQLVTTHNVNHSHLLISPQYLELRQAIVAALRPYAEAARAVSAALAQLETAAAKQITEAKAPIVIDATAEVPA